MKSLESLNHELSKTHILDRENSTLAPELQFQLDRLISAAKLLDKNPIKKHALALHHRKYPEISLQTAYKDLNDAASLDLTFNTFDWDFWQGWIIKDISENISRCKNLGTPQHLKIITTEHANLLKAIGSKPPVLDDPIRHQNHQFFLMVQFGKRSTPVDLEKLKSAPGVTIKELNKLLFSRHDIDDVEDEDIMNS